MNIKEWLKSLGLGCYADTFIEHNIDIKLLSQLTEDDLKELGIGSVVHRKKILIAIDKFEQEKGQKVSPHSTIVDLSQLPSILAIPLAEYFKETNPILKLWNACHVAELTLRFAVVTGLADLKRGGKLKHDLLTELQYRIEKPTFGEWKLLAAAVSKRLSSKKSIVPELIELVNTSL